jgi:hypothetical protein
MTVHIPAHPEAVNEDKLPGGRGDGRGVHAFDAKEVEMGRKVEREHSDDPEIIDEIVCDHLSENPAYYSKLNKAGLADELKDDA